MKKKHSGNNKIIGVFTADLMDAYQSAIWQGIKHRAEESGTGLICFAGSRINSPQIPEATANVVYDMAAE